MNCFHRSVVVCLLFCGYLFSAQVEAHTWKTEYFLDSLQSESAKPYAFQYWQRALASLSDVVYNDKITNQYQPFLNRISLNRSMSLGNEEIRSWDKLSPIDLGILAHESWHAYLNNFIKQEPEFQKLKRFFLYRAKNLFWELPESKAETALDEAYATFIGNTMMSIRWLDMMTERSMESEDIDCGKYDKLVEQIWRSNWESDIKGYYYRDSIDEYWTDRAKTFWKWLTGSKKDDRKNYDGVFYTEQGLTELDKKWILNNVFESRISKDRRESFQEFYEKMGCSEE